MGIVFSNTSLLSGSGNNSINLNNQIVQFVDNTATVNASATTAAWVNLLSTTITTSKNNNRVLVEYMCNHRNDFTQGNWSLTYHRMLVSGPNISNAQIMYSGHMGSASLNIGYYERQFLYTASLVGTYTFTAQGLAFQGTSTFGTNNSGSTNHYLRLYEIGS